MVHQNEEDIDSEIQQLLNRYEKKVKAEREEGARLKGENGIMRKKFNTLNKDIEENKSEISRMAENEKKLQSVIAGFEKDIQNLRKEACIPIETAAFFLHWWDRWRSVTSTFKTRKRKFMTLKNEIRSWKNSSSY
jgi:septal ring factor EnvC (AmiA/AmiB activator)